MINVVDGEYGLVDVVAKGRRVHGVGTAAVGTLQYAVGEGPVEAGLGVGLHPARYPRRLTLVVGHLCKGKGVI